jgi:hypothetical protein
MVKSSVLLAFTLACTVATPADASSVGWWPLDETSGLTATDEAAAPNDGTLMGAPGPARIAGHCGNALSFDGIDDFVEVSDHGELDVGAGDFSIALWVKDVGDEHEVFVDKRSSPPIGYTFVALFGHLVLQLADGLGGGAGFTNFTATETLPDDGQWHHVAATVDRSESSGGKLYVDGVIVLTFDPTVRPGTLDNAAPLWMGRNHIPPIANPNDEWLDGAMDEVRLYKRVLAATEVAYLQGCPPPVPIEAGPFLYPANGHLYFLLDCGSWTDCEAGAQQLGGHLVTVNNEAENEWVFDTFSAVSLPPAEDPDCPCFWIGYRDSAVEGEWRWVSGREPGFQHWSPGEPSNQSQDEDYAHLWGQGHTHPGRWNDMLNSGYWAGVETVRYGIVEFSAVVPSIQLPGLIALMGVVLLVARGFLGPPR